MNTNILPFIITSIAGLSTIIGYFIIYLKCKNYNTLINNSMSFASGIMFSISILDLIPEGLNLIKKEFTIFSSIKICILSIILGLVISYILDKNIESKNKLYKTGLISMIIIIIHNIPEGIITFITSRSNIRLGGTLAFSIAMHNIPEGIIISLPIYYSLHNKKKTFFYTLVSALSEPLGAIIALLFINYVDNNLFLGIIFNIIAGFMISLSLIEINDVIKSNYTKIRIIIYFTIGFIITIINLIL